MPRALVVEDEAIATMAINLMLESIGCTVIGAVTNGREAITLALELAPDVILNGHTAQEGRCRVWIPQRPSMPACRYR